MSRHERRSPRYGSSIGRGRWPAVRATSPPSGSAWRRASAAGSRCWRVAIVARVSGARHLLRVQQHQRSRGGQRRHPQGAGGHRQAPRRVPGRQGAERRAGGAHRRRPAAADRATSKRRRARSRDRRSTRAPSAPTHARGASAMLEHDVDLKLREVDLQSLSKFLRRVETGPRLDRVHAPVASSGATRKRRRWMSS